jgi:hypothetical protein
MASGPSPSTSTTQAVQAATHPRVQGTMSGNFKATLVANHVRQLTADAALGAFTAGASSQCTTFMLTET